MKFDKTTVKERDMSAKFKGRFSADGGLEFGAYTRMHLKEFAQKNLGLLFEIVPLLPESNKQRRFFEGALCPLVAFYQEGMDHRSYKDRETVREWLKMEFNSDLVALNGKTHRVAKSTKNRLNKGFLERVVNWIIDNYSPPMEAMMPEKYKHWRDAIKLYGGPDNYIDYLLEINIL